MNPVRMAAMFSVTVLVIYPLSIGPAFLLDFKLGATAPQSSLSSSHGPSQTFSICYYPILSLAFDHPSIAPPLEWYVRLWFPPSERG